MQIGFGYKLTTGKPGAIYVTTTTFSLFTLFCVNDYDQKKKEMYKRETGPMLSIRQEMERDIFRFIRMILKK